MNWNKIIIAVSDQHVDAVYGQLIMADIEDIEVVSDAMMLMNDDEKNWDYFDEKDLEESQLIIYRNDELIDSTLELVDTIKNQLSLQDIQLKVVVEKKHEKDWQNEWKKYFKAKKVTDKLVIKPEWEEYKKVSEDEIILEIDPGMAFGTGTHETTSMCMQLIEKYLSVDSKDVLDVGCGSGILSIASKLLGARTVTGIDIEEVAVTTSYENAKKNHIEDITFLEGDLTKNVEVKADIIVANIIADIIIILLDDIKNNMKGERIFIASGIILEKEAVVVEALESKGFKILEIKRASEWVAIASQLKE